MPARNFDSYKETLYALLDFFNPKKVIEWGSGLSTQIISLYPSVEKIKSVENYCYFYNQINRMTIPNLELVLEPDMDDYSKVGIGERFDFSFVDGRNRSECLKTAKEISDFTLLHDAKREDYRNMINSFNFKIWTDEGNTVVLTNKEDIFNSLLKCLLGMSCEEPSTEKIHLCEEQIKYGMVS